MFRSVVTAAGLSLACISVPASATAYALSVDMPATDYGAFIQGEAAIDPLTLSAGDTLDLTLKFATPLDIYKPLAWLGKVQFPVEIGFFTPGESKAEITASYELIDASPSFLQAGGASSYALADRFAAEFSFVPNWQKRTGTIGGISVHYAILSGQSSELRQAYFTVNFDDGVPEPTTWAMMLVGFGAIGAAARTGRRCALA